MTGYLSFRTRVTGCAVAALLVLSACDDAGNFSFGQPGVSGEGAQVTRASQTTKLVERDIEAPEVFQVTSAGLWDGRPSLGGVWVAHPDVNEPERVIVRNEATGKFVIGALFRKERETAGPKIQVSSDAANALGLIAGAPVQLNVTALRREQAPEAVAGAEVLPTPASVETSALDDPIAAAAAAIDAAAPNPQPIPGTDAIKTPAPTPVSAAGPVSASSLDKPFVQIGIFSVEANARRTADAMRREGVTPTVLSQQMQGKPFWRVVVGPIPTKSDRAEILKTVKSAGFTDAYFVTN